MDGNFSEKEIIEKRKKDLIEFAKKKKEWIYYIILAIITFIGVFLRTRNIDKLKDITTGTWTLGPDLDPFLFLRWAKYIVENGILFVNDAMRNVPLGFNTSGEMKLLSYMIAWFHNILSTLSLSDSVTYSAIIFPVFMFALTTIAFFLFARKVFYKQSDLIKNSIALLATFLFVLIPSLLPRTIAGIPEKESAAFFFMFMAFYFFLESFTNKNFKKESIFALFAGIFTGLMALIWGGFIFVLFTIAPSVLLAFLLGKIKWKKFYIYSIWLFSSFVVMIPFSTRYNLQNIVYSNSTNLALGVFVLIGFSLIFMKQKKLISLSEKYKFPKEIVSIIASLLVILILVSTLFGPMFSINQTSQIISSLTTPQETRFGFTVAENRQPYFMGEWTSSFGPNNLFGINTPPLFFLLFFIGSIFLFYNLIKPLEKKQKWILTGAYAIFIFSIIFSRYSSASVFNGESNLSLILYFFGWILFLAVLTYYYVINYRKENFYLFNKFNFSYILYFLILTLGIIAARSAIRLVMVLATVAPISIAFLSVKTLESLKKEKEETKKWFLWIVSILLIFILLTTSFNYYNSDKNQAENFAPNAYQWQWQRAMEWVRENTPPTIIENEEFRGGTVFAHWWDYGYWLQSIGERATILDGGNAIVYWNHLMGRYVLTETDQQKSLEFLYTHNATHLLIDSTEIGKYTAYSSIGADENYDRFSWISTFFMDTSKIVEQQNITIYPYVGGSVIDEDIIWKDEEGNEIFLPAKKSYVAGIIIYKDSKANYTQPEVIFVYQNKQYKIPIRYLFIEKEETKIDFNYGLESGAFIFPSLNIINGNQISLNENGAALFLSERVVNSNVARLYLFSEENENFQIVHSESSEIISNLKSQGLALNQFAYYQGLQGPIKIWEINYPSGITANEEFLETEYPNEELRLAKPGEYS